MSKKNETKVKKAVKKGYKSAKKEAKKQGKLKQFYIIVAVLLIIAIAAGTAYYFLVLKNQPKPPTVSDNFEFNTFMDIDTSAEEDISPRGKLEIHYIDVDQADCTLILLPDGRNMLIDAGDNNNATANHITQYLKKLGIKTIDYMMLTHCDSDHVGSMDNVLDNFEVKNIFMPKILPSNGAGTPDNRYSFITADTKFGVISTKVYYDFFVRADDETYTENGVVKETNLFANVDFMEIKGNGYSLEIYCFPESEYNKEFKTAKQKNEISPTVLLKYGGRQFLFTGDSCGTSHDNFEKMYRKRYINTNMDFDVYKAAHHGSSTYESNNLQFIKTIKTEHAILSCKEGKHNGIPSIEVMNNLKSQGNNVYRTDQCGDIKLVVTPNTSPAKMTFTADSNKDGIFTSGELKLAV